jgi:hypothetical protein
LLLLLTGSQDGTADRIVRGATGELFRFNLDLFSEYEITIKPDGWLISNPAGLAISSRNASRVFWWKAFSYGLDKEDFLRTEIKYIFQEIYNWFSIRKLVIGNSPFMETLMGKLNQLEVAKGYFRIPQTEVLGGKLHESHKDHGYIVKSFTSGLTVSSKAMFAQEIDPKSLSTEMPWLIQEKINSDLDVTVLVCGADHFAFSRSRKTLTGLDWRAEQFTDKSEWEPFDLTGDQIRSITDFIKAIGVKWGRVDFLVADDELVFLELNFNGQWVFLDPNNKFNLVKKVVNYLEFGETHASLGEILK